MKHTILGGLIGGTPKAPKIPDAPPPAPAPPAPPKPDAPPATPSPNSSEAQKAAIEAAAEIQERKKKSTLLTGPGGIEKEKFGNPADVKKMSLFGGGY